MGKSKHLIKVLALFEKSPVVDFKSIERIIHAKKNNYAKLLVSYLIKREVIKKIAKGCYTKYNDSGLVVLCFSPGYLGLQSALSMHGLWEQETIPVVITSKKVRTGLRNVLGGNALIRRAQRNFIFGVEYMQDGKFYLPYSDVEKTFIDMIVFKQKMSEEVAKMFIKAIDEKKLKRYLRVYSSKIKKRVMDLPL